MKRVDDDTDGLNAFIEFAWPDASPPPWYARLLAENCRKARERPVIVRRPPQRIAGRTVSLMVIDDPMLSEGAA